jgi:hypothetical protein
MTRRKGYLTVKLFDLEIQMNVEKIIKCLLEDDKGTTKEITNYFLFNKVFNYLIGFGINVIAL